MEREVWFRRRCFCCRRLRLRQRGLEQQPAADGVAASHEEIDRRARPGLVVLAQQPGHCLFGLAQACAHRFRRRAEAGGARRALASRALTSRLRLAQQARQFPAAVAAQLAAGEIVGLDRRRAFVNRRDPRVAHDPRGAGFLNIAHAAVNLHAHRGDFLGGLGAPGFGDGHEQLESGAVLASASQRSVEGAGGGVADRPAGAG